VDDLRFGSARELLWPFNAVTDRDNPDGANASRQAQDVSHFLIVECSDETGAQTLVYHREQDEHSGEAAVDDAVEIDASLSVPWSGPTGIRDDHNNQRSLSDVHLAKGGPRQRLFYPLVAHHDKFL